MPLGHDRRLGTFSWWYSITKARECPTPVIFVSLNHITLGIGRKFGIWEFGQSLVLKDCQVKIS